MAASQVNGVVLGRIVVQRTLEHLRRGAVVISSDVESLTMNTHLEGNENLGARHFLFENIPQLKYKSPHIKFDFQKQADLDSAITIIYKNGIKKEINCSNKSSLSILEEVKNLCSKHEEHMDAEQSCDKTIKIIL